MNTHTKLKLNAVAISLLAALGSHSLSVSAQQAEQADDVEVIEVSGIKGSLVQSMDLKRASSGVVDTITAEDIGKFPDTNLAESLQRITGVSIDRQNGEGNQITVRGLGPNFNMVTLNGRQMPAASSPEQESIASATQSRAFNFAEIGSESVSGVQVYKTAKAHQPTGGMGATVNIDTARPFDYSETTILANIDAVHDSSVIEGDDITPEFGGLFSTQFGDGMFGVLANVFYSERQFSELSTHTDGWLRDEQGGPGYAAWCGDATSNCADAPYVYRPVTNISEVQHNKRRRTNAQLVFQARPTDNVEITLDYVMSRFKRDQDRYQTGLFGVVDGSTVTGTRLTSNYTIDAANRLGGAADALVYENELVVENDSVGLNIQWTVNDSLSFSFDAHNSTAESQPDGELNDNLQLIQGPLGINFGLDYSGNGVDIVVDDSGAFRGQDQFGGGEPRPGVDEFQSVNGFSPLGSVLRNIAIENTVDQYQFEGLWVGDTYSLSAGVEYTDYQVETRAIGTGFFFQGLGDCTGCADAFTRTNIDAPSGFDVVVEFDVNALVDQTFPTSIDQILAQFPPTFFGASEESTALYVNYEQDLELGDMPAQIIVGGRYETTDVVGSAFQTFPVGLTITTNTEGSVIFAPDAAPEFFEVEADYSVFLPSIDFQIEPSDDHVVRVSVGKSIARPDLNALRPLTTVSDYRPGNSTASAGNPGLKPYSSVNIDLSYEWYYGEGSYFSLAYFNKQVDDYIATEVVEGTIPDINGDPLLDPQGRYVPTTSPDQQSTPVVSEPGDPEAIFLTSKPLNSVERSIDGFEIAIQHLFSDTGFGMQANYTVVDSDAEFDPDNFTQQSILLGLSDSWNLVGFYENDVFSLRLAANWRDEFLFSENQLRAPNEPVFFESYTQWDFSSSYVLTENLSLNFEVLNITGEGQRQRGRYADQFLYENIQEPRYALGLRGKF